MYMRAKRGCSRSVAAAMDGPPGADGGGPSERDLGSHHDRPVRGQPEVLDRARRVARHDDEELLAERPPDARSCRRDRDAGDEIRRVLEVEVALEETMLAAEAERCGHVELLLVAEAQR